MIREFNKQHLFQIEILCNIINVFTVTFGQFDLSLLIKIWYALEIQIFHLQYTHLKDY